jgi:hypothetical protein
VLIREIGQDGKASVILGKSLRVLPKTKLLKPDSDLLHRGSASDYRPASASVSRMGAALESKSGPAGNSEKC